MAFKLVLKSIVYWDISESITWYEKKLTGLGKRFFLQFEESINRILANPAAFSFLKPPVRRCKLKKFPHRILFLIKDNSIYILGVTSTRRSSAYLKRRLKLFE